MLHFLTVFAVPLLGVSLTAITIKQVWSPVAHLVERRTGDHRVAISSLAALGVPLRKTLNLVLSTGSTQEDPS